MQARAAFHGSAISKRMAAVVVAMLAAFTLGGIGGYLIKTVNVPAVPVAANVVAAQPAASGFGSAWNYSNRRSGTQTVEGPAPAGSPNSPSFRQPAVGRSGPQS
jgi:hypothetical protein